MPAAKAEPLYHIESIEKGQFDYVDLPVEVIRNNCGSAVKDCKSCTSDIGYLYLDTTAHATAKLNEQLRKSAGDWPTCAAAVHATGSDAELYTSLVHEDEPLMVSQTLASIRSFYWARPLGGNGSCHGGTQYKLFNLTSGKQYFLMDLIDASHTKDYLQLASSSLAKEQHTGVDTEQFIQYMLKKTDAIPVFIREGKLYANVGEVYPYISCAAGQDFPVEIPREWVTDALVIDGLAR